MSTKTKRRERNPVQTRLKLLQATIQLLAEKGVDSVSVKEAARIASVSRAAAYQHFDDRDHLLQEAKRWLSHNLESVARADSTSLDEQVHYVSRLVLSNREASRLLMADALSGKDLDTEHALYVEVMRMLQRFADSGEARGAMDIEVMLCIMLGSIGSLIMLGARDKDADIDTLARRFTTEWAKVLRGGIFLIDKKPAKRSRVAKSQTPRRKPQR